MPAKIVVAATAAEMGLPCVEHTVNSVYSSSQVEMLTRGQANNELWPYFRYGRITASRVGKIMAAYAAIEKKTAGVNDGEPPYTIANDKSMVARLNKLASDIAPDPFDAPSIKQEAMRKSAAVKWGIDHERDAIEAFAATRDDEETIIVGGGLRLARFGLSLATSDVYKWYGASPDGLMCYGAEKLAEHGDFKKGEMTTVIECKCPWSQRNKAPDEAFDDRFYLKRVPSYQADRRYEYELDRKKTQGNEYYWQMQMHMFVTNTDKAYLVVWTPHKLVTLTIYCDYHDQRMMLRTMDGFYKDYVVPRLNNRIFRLAADQLICRVYENCVWDRDDFILDWYMRKRGDAWGSVKPTTKRLSHADAENTDAKKAKPATDMFPTIRDLMDDPSDMTEAMLNAME